MVGDAVDENCVVRQPITEKAGQRFHNISELSEPPFEARRNVGDDLCIKSDASHLNE